jgi:hypothetical protein
MRRVDGEDPLRVRRGHLFPLLLGYGCQLDERYRGTRGLIRVLNRRRHGVRRWLVPRCQGRPRRNATTRVGHSPATTLNWHSRRPPQPTQHAGATCPAGSNWRTLGPPSIISIYSGRCSRENSRTRTGIELDSHPANRSQRTNGNRERATSVRRQRQSARLSSGGTKSVEPAMIPHAAARRAERVTTSVSLVVGPLLMSIGDLLHPQERMSPAEQIAIVAALRFRERLRFEALIEASNHAPFPLSR